MTLNPGQKKIAETTEGMIVVDAGPGTGKTHTVVQRYMNILNNDVPPADILLLTFTNNAANETEERVKGEMILSGRTDSASVRSSTFDAFCLKVVMESPETVREFFRTNETLTRSARMADNETLDQEYFRNVYTKFIRRHGKRYGNIPAMIGTSYGDLYNVIRKLMSAGIAPTHDDGWFGYSTGALRGREEELISVLLSKEKKVSSEYKRSKNIAPGREADNVTEEMIRSAVYEDRKELMFFINGIYYEFIRSSIADNRLTFGLTALFAFIILYSDKHIRKMMSFRYIMIDEFQDTNELQFLISLLILKEPNLCVVGDWKQGIYGFRYASVDNIKRFGERLEEMKRFLNKDEKRVVNGVADPVPLPLTENYRSTQLVIDTSFRALKCRAYEDEDVIDEGPTLLTAVNDSERTAVERLAAESADDEILAILAKIRGYVTDPHYRIVMRKNDTITERAPEYGDIAVLCRTGAMCIKVKQAADEYGIPAYLQGDVDIMATREGKLALAWLRYINNPSDRRGPVAILADAGCPPADLERMFPENGPGTAPEYLKEQRVKLASKKRRINDLLTSIFSHHGLNNDITQSVISVLSSAHSGSMLTIPDLIRLIEAEMGRSEHNVDALLDGRSVMIQTMHKSKGLEYPIVIIGGLNRSIMPPTRNDTGTVMFDPLRGIRLTKEYVVEDGRHRIFDSWSWKIIKNAAGTDSDGERRLFFVALSRAKQYITMTCQRSRASMFMKDIGGESIKDAVPKIEKMKGADRHSERERPYLPGYERRKKKIPLHELMGAYEESGGGKGAEHGIRVHREAQRIMSGFGPSSDGIETECLLRIYDSVKRAKRIMTETDCSLPMKDRIISGRIDMLAEFDDRVEVHDFKTDMNDKNEHRYRMQLSVYARAAASLGKPVKCFIDYVSQDRDPEPVSVMTEDEICEQMERLGMLS